jgi:thioredoxin-related protein
MRFFCHMSSAIPQRLALAQVLLLAGFSSKILAQEAPAPPTPPDGLVKRSGIIPKAVPVEPQIPTDPNAAVWERNPHQAFALAKQTQKPMLLLFTGQWNSHCQILSSEVFASKTFNRYAKENLVICFLDYPRDPLDTPDALRLLKEKFKINGLPVLLVFDPDGHVIHQQTGYRAGRPVDYFEELKSVTDTQLTELAAKRKFLVSKGFREWTNNKGQKIFAQFVQRTESSVTLKSPSGETWTLETNTLAPGDQLFAQSFPPKVKKAAK